MPIKNSAWTKNSVYHLVEWLTTSSFTRIAPRGSEYLHTKPSIPPIKWYPILRSSKNWKLCSKGFRNNEPLFPSYPEIQSIIVWRTQSAMVLFPGLFSRILISSIHSCLTVIGGMCRLFMDQDSTRWVQCCTRLYRLPCKTDYRGCTYRIWTCTESTKPAALRWYGL